MNVAFCRKNAEIVLLGEKTLFVQLLIFIAAQKKTIFQVFKVRLPLLNG